MTIRTVATIVLLLASNAHAAETLAITHVNVIDVSARSNDRALLRDRTVVITGDRITAVKSGRARIPRGAHVVDGTRKFLIPGLADMHVHVLLERRHEFAFPMLIANGDRRHRVRRTLHAARNAR